MKQSPSTDIMFTKEEWPTWIITDQQETAPLVIYPFFNVCHSRCEALAGLPPLDIVIKGEARSAAHHLWSLGCWTYLLPIQGHSCILTWLQKSAPIFNMGVNVMKPVFNLKPKHRVTMLTREEWTRGTRTPHAVKGLVWFTDRSRTAEGTRAEVYGQSANRRLKNSLGNMLLSFRLRCISLCS